MKREAIEARIRRFEREMIQPLEQQLAERERMVNEANARLALMRRQRDAAFRELGWKLPDEPERQVVYSFIATGLMP